MEPIFTRYLYEKREVMHSLLLALISRLLDPALFWTYELWFSGFEQEVWDWIFCIYEEFYKRLNPRYERILYAKYIEYETTKEYRTKHNPNNDIKFKINEAKKINYNEWVENLNIWLSESETYENWSEHLFLSKILKLVKDITNNIHLQP
jgi:hypothetical protein